MKIKKMLVTVLVIAILSTFVMSLMPMGSGKSYAAQMPAGTITSDIEGIDETLYPGYKEKLKALKESNPNYVFQLYYTGLNWNEVVNAEYKGHGSSPLNLFQVKSNYEGMWYCPICGTQRYDNGSLCCASKEAISYMMDPRNSMNTDDIFQFKTLDGSDVTIDDIRRVVAGKGTFINNEEAIQAIYDASVTYNINGYFLVAKIINEHGNNGTVLTAGNGYGGNYVSCYNYFNVNSFGNGTAAIINNGLAYAQSKGWTSIRASIMGGTEIVKNNYINTRGQKTLYYQKFNVVYKDALFSYQYQANIMAAQSQGTSLKSYYGEQVNSKQMTFIIPVYENMPKEACGRPDTTKTNTISFENGVVTNIRTSLTVRASASIKGLAIGKLNNEESIKILQRATEQVDGYYWDLIVSNIDGTYGYAARIVGGENCITSLGTTGSSSGAPGVPSVDTENTPEDSETKPQEGSNIIFEENHVKSIPNANVETIKEKNPEAIIKNLNGEVVEKGKLGTGYTVTVGEKVYTVVKKGDVNGDGNANITDAISVLNHLKGTNSLVGANLEAAKVNGNSNANITDAILLLNYIKGIADIKL